MTRQKTLKRRIRARMAKTGESYSAARAQLLRSARDGASPSPPPAASPDRRPLLAGYPRCGGLQTETATACNVLRHAGVTRPDGRPFTEAMLWGLGGGVGVQYFVFEYAGLPPTLSITLRQPALPGPFVDAMLRRTGVAYTTHETGSERVASRTLDVALGAGKAAICTVDGAALPYSGAPGTSLGMTPHNVAVVGLDAGAGVAWVDDRADVPLAVPRGALEAARAGYRKARRRLITVDAPAPAGHDLGAAALEAVRWTARTYREAPYQGFAGNFGLRGLDKWAALLDDPRDPKGWSRLFSGTAAHAFAGLRRVWEGIEAEYVPPGGGRALYAEFLGDVAEMTGRDGLRDAAGRFAEAGALWHALAESAIPADDPALVRAREITDERRELLEAHAADTAAAAGAMRAMWDEQHALGESCSVVGESARERFADLAARVRAIRTVEADAVEALDGATA